MTKRRIARHVITMLRQYIGIRSGASMVFIVMSDYDQFAQLERGCLSGHVEEGKL